LFPGFGLLQGSIAPALSVLTRKTFSHYMKFPVDQAKKSLQDINLSLYPRTLTVRRVRQFLAKPDADARKELADLILHRLRDRYITPLEHVEHNDQTDYRSGFLMMAAACLMIETFQCFREGKKDTTGWGEGKKAFKKFFSDYNARFPGIDGEEFYKKIRNGILHQAQTHGRFQIWRYGKLFDSTEKRINATEFLEILKKIVEDYVDDLRVQDMDSEAWEKALLKIGYICDAIENE
jgi:hypothetical protein